MLTRRALITRVGAAGAGSVVFLWPSAAEAESEAAGPVLASTKGIPVGGGKIVKGKYVITQPRKGLYKCFSAKCTHQGCTVASVSRGAINCPCHGSKFNLDGSVANGPATKPLEPQAVTVQGDSIVLG